MESINQIMGSRAVVTAHFMHGSKDSVSASLPCCRHYLDELPGCLYAQHCWPQVVALMEKPEVLLAAPGQEISGK